MDSIKERISDFESITSQLDEKKYNDYNFTHRIIPHLDSIEKIPFVDIFSVLITSKIFKRKKRITAFNEIFRYLSIVKNSESVFLSNINRLEDNLKAFYLEWSIKMDLIREHFDYYLFIMRNPNYSNNVNDEFKAFFTDYDAVVGKWQNLENRTDIFIMYDNYILPLEKVVHDHKKVIEVLPLRTYIMKGKLAFGNYKKLRETNSVNFKEIIKRYYEASIKIKEGIMELK